ncbi:MAG: efflux RND transporter periplasmic adaptor subunit [Anaerolineaceae bacterium]|nr:efflux RND transporter periplasmic adaptor subunit [Anaerolineaceae bacterium]
MKAVNRFFESKFWPVFVILTLLVAAGGGYYIWQARQKAAAVAKASPYTTSAVTRGSLMQVATGSASVVSNQVTDLSFPVSGTIAQINVIPGDTVKVGEVLATMSGTDQLQLAVTDKELSLQTAQKALDDLQTNAAVTLSNAQLAVATAQSALLTAQQNLRVKGVGRCSVDTIQSYYVKWSYNDRIAITAYQHLVNGKATPTDYVNMGKAAKGVNSLITAQAQYNADYVNWSYCQGYTDTEITTSQVNLQVAQANLAAAQAKLAKLQANNGIDPDALALDQATVQADTLSLQDAKNQLVGATMTSPVNGVVVSVAGTAGATFNTGIFIVIADLSTPTVQINMDDTDLQNINVGCNAQITFASIPGHVFSGQVTQITPTLVTVRGSIVLQGQVQLVKDATVAKTTLPLGLSAMANVICNQVTNALLAPVDGLHTDQNGSYYVYVLNSAGKPVKTAVEIGLANFTSAEVKSGLKEGDLVITKGI